MDPHQLKSLTDRLNQHQQETRQDRIYGRKQVAQYLRLEQAKQQGQLNQLAQFTGALASMGLWARLRWMILGINYINTTGTIILALGVLGLLVLWALVFYAH